MPIMKKRVLYNFLRLIKSIQILKLNKWFYLIPVWLIYIKTNQATNADVVKYSLHGSTKTKKGQKMAKNEFSNDPDKGLVSNNRYVLRNIKSFNPFPFSSREIDKIVT